MGEKRRPRGGGLEALDQIWAAIPDEEMQKLPTDLADQHDHYAYGLPKKAVRDGRNRPGVA